MMKDGSSSTSSTADVLVHSIKEDLTAFITERQQLEHRKQIAINKLNELNQRQKEVFLSIPETCSTLQRVLSETANQIVRDGDALDLELQSSKTIAEVLSRNQDEICRSVFNSKETLGSVRANYACFKENANKFIDFIRTAVEKIRELQREYDRHQSQIRAVCEERNNVQLKTLQAEKDHVNMESEKEKTSQSLNCIAEQLNEQKIELHSLESKSIGILAEKEKFIHSIDKLNLWSKQLTEFNIQRTLDTLLSEINRYASNVEIKKGEKTTIERRLSEQKRDVEKANNVLSALESDTESRKCRIVESQQFHSEILQKIEKTRNKMMENSSVNERLQSGLESRKVQLKKILDEQIKLRDEERSLQLSNDNDTHSLTQLNACVSNKRGKLSRVEEINKRLTSLIGMRSSLHSEMDLTGKKCETLRQEQVMPTAERVRKLETRKAELEQEKYLYVERQAEARSAILEAKEKIKSAEAKRDAVESSLQESMHRSQRLKSEFDALAEWDGHSAECGRLCRDTMRELEDKKEQLLKEEQAYHEAFEAQVQCEAERMQNELKEKLQNVKTECQNSVIQCSSRLAERLQTLRNELDGKPC